MIHKNFVIEIHDDKFKALLSNRGCFPVVSLSDEKFIDWQSGNEPSSNGDNYRVLDILKCIGNLRRSNFIELLFGVPVEKEIKHRKLF